MANITVHVGTRIWAYRSWDSVVLRLANGVNNPFQWLQGAIRSTERNLTLLYPEMQLHPRQQEELVRQLKALPNERVVTIATHSPWIVDAAPTLERVICHDGGIQKPLSHHPEAAEWPNMTPAEFWQYAGDQHQKWRRNEP